MMKRTNSWLYNAWTSFIINYSRRALTYTDDKLLAIAGVAKVFSSIMKQRFLAGLWDGHLIHGLLWSVVTTIDRPLKYRAPSWSWASCDGDLAYSKSHSSDGAVARVLEAECETTSGDGFGVVTSGHVLLEACSFVLAIDDGGDWWATWGEHQSIRSFSTFDNREDLSSLRNVRGAILQISRAEIVRGVRVDPYRGGPSDSADKFLLTAHGLILANAAGPNSTPTTGLSKTEIYRSSAGMRDDFGTCMFGAPDSIGRYRRIGRFSVVDDTSNILTPQWLPPGLRLFTEHWASSRVDESEGRPGFPFDEQHEFLSRMVIV